MKIKLWHIIIVFFFNGVVAQTNNSIFNIKTSQIIDIKTERDSSLSEAYKTLTRFLFFRDKSLVLNNTSIDSNYIKLIFDNLFIYNSLPNEYINFFVYQVYGDKESGYDFSVLATHNYSLYPKDQQDYTLYYIYNARLVLKDDLFKVDISPQYGYKFTCNNITYYYNSKNDISKKINKVSKFIYKKT